MGVFKEFWLSVIKEQFDQVPSFLQAVTDLSQFVENNKLHLAEAGVDPDVLINVANYPIPIVDREDIPYELSLDTADSENTPIRGVEKVQLSYDKTASVTRRHAAAILNKIAAYATFNFSPSADGTYTPVIPTTGNTAMVSGFKDITEDDVLILADKFDAIDAPDGDRALVLHDKHYNQLLKTSTILREQQKFMGKKGKIDREILNLYGFDIFKYKSKAVYNKSTGQKKAWGAAAAPSTDTISSFAFVGSEVMKAFGDMDMYFRLKDPEHRADIIGFQRRFAVLPMRNKYIGAIYSAASA